MLRRGPMYLALAALLLLLWACTGQSGGSGSQDKLSYAGPTEQTVPRGEYMPGTDIQYLGNSGEGATVLIGGQQAIKKTGDSLDWEGSPVPGVSVDLAQRVVLANDERLITGGTVEITVDEISPAPTQFPDQPLYSYKVPVAYSVKRGDTIPGTTVSYVGKGEDGAEFSGVSGYPYRKLADSISWQGALRPNAYIDMTLRVVLYTDDAVQLGGIATIGLTEG